MTGFRNNLHQVRLKSKDLKPNNIKVFVKKNTKGPKQDSQKTDEGAYFIFLLRERSPA